MKNSKEMADSVFQIRDAYLEKQRKRKKQLKRAAYISSTFCMFGIILVGFHFMKPDRNQIPTMTIPEVSSTIENTTASDEPNYDTESVHSDDEGAETDNTSHITESQTDSPSETQEQEMISSEEPVDVQEYTDYQEQYIEPDVREDEPITTEIISPSYNESEPTEQIPSEPEETIPSPEQNIIEEDVLPEQSIFENWTLEELYSAFPEIHFERSYHCINAAITEDMLELAIAEVTIKNEENISADVVVYTFSGSTENDEIAVWFYGRNDYIVYQAN